MKDGLYSLNEFEPSSSLIQLNTMQVAGLYF